MKPMHALLAILLLANAVSAVALVYSRQEARRAYVELSQLERARDELNIEYGQLQLESSTWRDSLQVEQVAKAKLGMDVPSPEQTVVLRR